MRMQVKCGNMDCRNEFYVDTMDPVWICDNCSREIINANYPFLTAKLMQAKIEGEQADWKEMFGLLLDMAKMEISQRNVKGLDVNLRFLDSAEEMLIKGSRLTNAGWREEHDRLLAMAREVVLMLDRENTG
ncbi:MAG: hypothetical protein ACMUIE_04115 [Thermoplasmatota archaeon]